MIKTDKVNSINQPHLFLDETVVWDLSVNLTPLLFLCLQDL